MKRWLAPALLALIAVVGFVLEKRSNAAKFAALQNDVDSLSAPTATQVDREPREANTAGPLATLVLSAPERQVAPSATSTNSREVRRVRPQDLSDHYEAAFVMDNVDASWAGKARQTAQQRATANLPSGSAIRLIECHTSMCRIETTHPDKSAFLEFVHKSFGDPSSGIWNAGSFATVVSETAQGRIVAVAYLAREGAQLPTISDDAP